MMDERARLTMPDVVQLLVGFAFATPLLLVFFDALGSNAGTMSTGAVWMWRLVPGFLILVILSVIYLTSVGGVGR